MKYFTPLIGKGCSKEEIQTIKNSFSFDLPAAYLEFLELVGKGYGNKSSRFYFFNTLTSYSEIKKEAQGTIFFSKKKYQLDEYDVVFYSEDGNRFAFLNALKGENPPVYGFKIAQAEEEPILLSETFSEFIMSFEDRIELIPNLRTDAVLYKTIMRPFEYPNFDFESIVLKKSEVALPEDISIKLSEDFSGIDFTLAENMILDFILEKSHFEIEIFECVRAMMTLSNGDFNSLKMRYLHQVMSPNRSPQRLIDELLIKTSNENEV